MKQHWTVDDHLSLEKDDQQAVTDWLADHVGPDTYTQGFTLIRRSVEDSTPSTVVVEVVACDRNGQVVVPEGWSSVATASVAVALQRPFPLDMDAYLDKNEVVVK